MIESVSGQMVRPIRPSYSHVNIEINMAPPRHHDQTRSQAYHEKNQACPNCGYYYNVPQVSIYNSENKKSDSQNSSEKVLVFPQQTVIERQEAPKTKTTAEEKENENSNKVTNPISNKKPEALEVQEKKSESKTVETKNDLKQEPIKAAEPKKVEVVKPENLKPVIDINTFIAELASADYARQADAMNIIAQVCNGAPEIAQQLLDVRVIDTLLGIINADTSHLPAPTQRQLQIRNAIINGQNVSQAERIEASVKAPVELAEQNKEFAIYTLAAMQKVFGEQVEKMNGKVVPLSELPGAKEIIKEVGTNPNPHIKVAGLGALNYIRTPQYSAELQNIYQKASADENPVVRAVAQKAIELNA